MGFTSGVILVAGNAVIFDLDGVIIDTAKMHFLAWKTIADSEGIYFDEKTNEFLKGVSRMESLNIILGKKRKEYSPGRLEYLAKKKNQIYRVMLRDINPTDVLPGIKDLIKNLNNERIKIGLCSASKNTDYIIQKIEMESCFAAIVTGNDSIKYKPDPEGFLLVAKKLDVNPKNCIVIEDALAGIEAAVAAGMKCIGIGDGEILYKADDVLPSTEFISLEKILVLYQR